MDLLYSLLILAVDFYKLLERGVYHLVYPIHVRKFIRYVFHRSGIRIDKTATGPYDIRIKESTNEREMMIRIANNPSLGLGETYMEGLWECDKLDELMFRIFKLEIYKEYLTLVNRVVNFLIFSVFNLQTKDRVWEVAQKHYDKGNNLFEAFLDPAMNYSCGYWKNAKNLEEAQIHKMELIAKKLKLEPGMKVLDIGCGWGGLCKHLADNYKVHVVGCTISKEQQELARANCKNSTVDIQLVDYRDITEKFDRIVSVGMFEHVGKANYRTFFQSVSNNLEEDGIFLLHTIGVSHPGVPLIEPWFHKYIFPNGILPYQTEIPKYCDGLFIIEDWHNFGNDYAKTLGAWRENFHKAWPSLAEQYGEKFFRMWNFYLSLSIGAFRSRKYQLWQVTLTKNGIEGGYESVR